MGAWLKRIVLFAVVNMFILLTMSIAFTVITSLLGIRLGGMESLLIWYSLIGMGGAFISLAMSRQLAIWGMGVQILDPNSMDPEERRLVNTVHELASRAGLTTMPEVGIFQSEDLNAFATGPSRSSSLVAVSSGLLRSMDRDALRGVLGHEITHIANGDMVTMTLIQGVINTMVLIVARLLASVIAGSRDNRSRGGFMEYMTYIGLQMVLSLLGSVVVCYFSRWREYRADAGGAQLAGRQSMIAGLRTLQRRYEQISPDAAAEHPSMATLQISGNSGNWLTSLFATHPPLEDRIRRLEMAQF